MLTIIAPLWAALAFGERSGVATARAPERDAAAWEQPGRTGANHADRLGLLCTRAAPFERMHAQVFREANPQRVRDVAGLSSGTQTSALMAVRVRAPFPGRAEAVR